MKTKRQVERAAKQLLILCTVNGNMDESRVRLAVEHILRSKHRGYFLLLARFLRVLKYIHANHVVKIESAARLAPALCDQLQTRLAALYGPGLTFLFLNNPALIGGIKIRVASDVYDGSVQLALMTLANNFGLSTADATV
jgi:F-type H+-transporting ATPase subunit delta